MAAEEEANKMADEELNKVADEGESNKTAAEDPNYEPNPTTRMQNKLVEWNRKFLENCQKEPAIFYDEGDINVLWDIQTEGADVKNLEELGEFACVPHIFWNKDMITYFTERDCGVSAKDKGGSTALHYAVRYAWEKNDVIQFLLEKGADPKIRDADNKMPISYLPNSFLTSHQPDSIRNFEMLLGHPGTTNQHQTSTKDIEKGDTVLHRAVEILDVNLLKGFLENFEGSVDLRNDFGKTPFMVAVAKGKLDTCRVLLDRGAEVNAIDSNGYTALHQAVYDNNELSCLAFLMEKNADPNLRTYSGRDVYEVACLRNTEFAEGANPSKIIQLFEMKGAIAIISEGNYREGLEQWTKALNLCREKEVNPNLEFLSSYELLSTSTEDERMSDQIKLELFRAAIKTLDRISTGSSKLWNVLFAAFHGQLQSLDEMANRSEGELIEILSFISDKMKSFVEDNASMEGIASMDGIASMEGIDITAFVNLVEELHDQKCCTSNDTHFILNFGKLAVACFSKWIRKAGTKRIKSLGSVYYRTCLILTRAKPKDAPSKEWMVKEIRGLIKSVVELDPIDGYSGNTLLHSACQSWDRDLVQSIIDIGTANYKSVNDDKWIPLQLISSETFRDKRNVRIIKDIYKKSSPAVNLTNAEGELIKELFKKCKA